MLHARLARGPIDVEQLLPNIDAALEERFGSGYDFGVRQAAIIDGGAGPALDVKQLSLRTATGRLVFDAPNARLAVNPLALLVGRVSVRRLEIFDLELRLIILPNGELAIAAGADPNDAVSLTRAFTGMSAGAGAPADPSGAQAAETGTAPPAAPEARRGAVLKQAADGLRGLLDFLTGPESPLAAIELVGVSRAKLVIDDRAARQTWQFDGLELQLKKDAEGTHFRLSAQGPSGRWSASALAKGARGESQSLRIELTDLSRDEIAIFSGMRAFGFDFDMPVSARFDMGLKADGSIETVGGRFGLGAGFVRLDDPDHEPLMVDEVTGGFVWNNEDRRFDILKTQFFAGLTTFAFRGQATPPQKADGVWTIEGALDGPAVYGPEKTGDIPIDLTRGRLAARIDVANKRLLIDSFEVGGPETDLKLDATLTWFDGQRLKLGLSTGRMPARTVLRLWPGFVAPPVRNWLMSHLQGGTFEHGRIDVNFDPVTFKYARAFKPLPDDSAVAIDFKLVDGKLDFLRGAPPLQGVQAVGRVTARTTSLDVSSAYLETRPGARLNLSGASFKVADTGIPSAPATIDTRVVGNIDAVADLLNTPALKPYATIPLDANTIKGQIEGRFGLDLRLGPEAGPDNTHMNIQANVSNFSAQKLVGKEGLEAANLSIAVDSTGIVATGQGRLFGAPTMIDMRKPADRVGEAAMSLTLDDALRAKHGFGQIPGLSGPIGVRFAMPLGGKDKPKAQVEMDLTKASLDGAIPGFSKPAGRPAKLTFAVTAAEGPMTLENLAFDGGGAMARGTVELAADGGLLTARLPQVKMSPSDDMRVDMSRSGDALKVVVRGANIDARPVLKSLLSDSSGPSSSGAGGGVREVDVDIKSPIVTGFNRQIASGVEIRIVKRGGALRQAQVTGRFGRDGITISTAPGEDGAPVVRVGTADAGSLLSFLDVYKRMEGGAMALAMRTGDNRLDGTLTIRDFVLRDEPALRRLVNEAPPAQDASGRARINPTLVQFSRFSTVFARIGSRIELRDATIYSPAIGTTAEGWVDFGADKVDMSGTFVPAYGLNNLLARIPVVGLIIGGGSNEGIFGVNYRLTGSISAPVLNVNPLSAIAPGIFRKIFGAGQALPPQAPAGAPPAIGAQPQPRSDAPLSIAPKIAPPPVLRDNFSPER